MAVTKTHPIKSTLKAAIDYICNPDKTDGKLLVSSFGCAAETADIEFEWTRRHSIDKGTHLGRHLIQAFEPGEVSPEEAHEIGMQLDDFFRSIKPDPEIVYREYVKDRPWLDKVTMTDDDLKECLTRDIGQKRAEKCVIVIIDLHMTACS